MQGPLSRVARLYCVPQGDSEGTRASVYTRAADVILDIKALSSKPNAAQLERCCNGLQRVMAEMPPHEPFQDELSRVHDDLRRRLEISFETLARPVAAAPKLSGEAVLWFDRKLFVG
ncbi:MAG: uncharacterized protein KVP18_003524 [Porospora cf. gigantea A]|uniref:uncharacterized protein n=1 Tax=Porospora cf. gigantea A TaxID=2853593 RepID=UPI0035597B0B|nr:MAG: hypothetical protein KVP18_003524 [Porospora cf. gigantea A]